MTTTVIERFLRYTAVNTVSQPDCDSIPSTQIQFDLARILVKELKELGASDVRMDDHAYVYASIPATSEEEGLSLGFIAHMDTSPDFSGKNVRPMTVKNYDGGDITLNPELGIVMKTETYPYLKDYVGKDLITTDGTTLLGADDKAGIAEIMALAEYLLAHPEIPHGKILIGFTPDEEVGHGADGFDVEGFGADVAYTVDGGALGEIEYENFNAASARVTVHGSNIHPGSSKGKMVNSLLIAMEFHGMLPVFDNPMYTEGYEGFYHLNAIRGDVETTRMNYIVRDHDMDKFTAKKEHMVRTARYLNEKYGEGTVELELRDTYYNMKEKIRPHMYLIDIAREAMEECGVKPDVCPIRGGTDGATLSYKGLPCPNLCAGYHNAHGKYEFACVQSMETIVEILFTIVRKFAGLRRQDLS